VCWNRIAGSILRISENFYYDIIRHKIYMTQGVNLGWLGVATPRFWAGLSWGVAGGREILSYYVQEVHVCSKVVNFEEK